MRGVVRKLSARGVSWLRRRRVRVRHRVVPREVRQARGSMHGGKRRRRIVGRLSIGEGRRVVDWKGGVETSVRSRVDAAVVRDMLGRRRLSGCILERNVRRCWFVVYRLYWCWLGWVVVTERRIRRRRVDRAVVCGRLSDRVDRRLNLRRRLDCFRVLLLFREC